MAANHLHRLEELNAENIHNRTPLIWINWDAESSGYAENPDNWIFLTGYIGSFEVRLLLSTVCTCV